MDKKMSFNDFVATQWEGVPPIALNIKECKQEYKKYLDGDYSR